MNYSIERLENRLLLAANAVLKGSTLTITFTGDDNDVVLTGTGEGAVTVAGTDTAVGPFTGVKSIKVIGEDGDNEIDLIDIQISGNLSFDMKGGDDDVDIEGSGDTDIGGGIKAKMGAGDDRFEIDASGSGEGEIQIGKNVSVDMGDATSSDYFESYGDETGEDVTIGGSLTVKQTAGNIEIEIDSTAIAKNLKLDVGDGDDEILISNNTVDNTQIVTVGKDASIKTGEGNDIVTFGEEIATGRVDITKNLTIDLGNADNTDNLDLRFDVAADDLFHVGGNVSIKGKAGSQDLQLDGFDIDGSVKVSLGDGEDGVEVNQLVGDIDSTIGKGLTLSLGDGDDLVNVEQLAVAGKMKADGGGGAADQGEITVGGGVAAGAGSSGKNFEVGDLQAG